MKNTHVLAAALLAALSLTACGNAPSPPAPPAPPAAPDAPKTFIGRHVDKALAEARKELATGNISISDGFNINVNGREIHHKGDNLPKG